MRGVDIDDEFHPKKSTHMIDQRGLSGTVLACNASQEMVANPALIAPPEGMILCCHPCRQPHYPIYQLQGKFSRFIKLVQGLGRLEVCPSPKSHQVCIAT